MHRFFLPAETWKAGGAIDLTPLHHQLAHVLRLTPGTCILLLDGEGRACTVELRRLDRRHAAGVVLAVEPAPPEPRLRLTLYQCALKGDKLEWVWQKGTELGVARFVPVVSRRTVVPAAALAGKAGRWASIVREAAEQSGRGAVPIVAPPVDWSTAVQTASGMRLLPWEAATDRPGMAAALAAGQGCEVSLLIGPEGGLDPGEVMAAQAAGWQVVSLGTRILRAETAALAAVTLVMAAAGELGKMES